MSYYKATALYQKQSQSKSNLITETTITGDRPENNTLNIVYEAVSDLKPGSPEVFGNPAWFTLHNGAAHYPLTASVICAQRMKGYILGIPVMLPCENCSDHATAFIESHRDKLDYIVSGRIPLFEFFVNFHNHVNKRLGKPEISMDQAWKIYQSPVVISKMTYGLKN